MERRQTERGFNIIEFTDRYGLPCSLQESSLAGEDAIWLGVHDPQPKVLVHGEGWKPVDLQALVDGELHLSTRMHLTVEMVRELLPYLQSFVEKGDLADA